jgi:hypothetical protein
MLVIPIELWPFGIEPEKRQLGKLTIANDGTGSSSRGNYDVTVYGAHGRIIRTARVEDWPRQAKPVQGLILAALEAAGYGKDSH